jgi:hypothetical protein
MFGVNRLRLILSIWLAVTDPSWGQDVGKDLFHKMQRALGGEERIAAIRDFEEIVNAETFAPAGQSLGFVQKRTRWIAPNHLRIDQIGPGDTYVLYFDGTSGWEILPDRTSQGKTAGGEIELVGDELKFARQYLSGFIFKKWLADRQPGYSVSSPANNVVRITDDDGHRTDVTLDPRTWLPLAESSPRIDVSKPPSTEMRIGGWTRVKGVQFPVARANYHDGARLAAMTAERIRVNSGLKVESLQAKPPDSLPRMVD